MEALNAMISLSLCRPLYLSLSHIVVVWVKKLLLSRKRLHEPAGDYRC